MGNLQQLQAVHDLAENVAKAEQLIDMAAKLLADASTEAAKLATVDQGALVAHHTTQWVRDAAKRAAHAKQAAQNARMYVRTDLGLAR